jgi:ParB-like chromosome segregation protein Spo0J
MTKATVLETSDHGLVVDVPLKLKKRAGRKEVILTDAFGDGAIERMPHQEALVVALARAHRWQRLLDDGKFKSVSDLAREIGLDVSFAARLLRLTLLAPNIVEAILMGEEPSGLSLTMLTKQQPVVWEEQVVQTLGEV